MQDNIQNEIAQYLKDVQRAIMSSSTSERTCQDVKFQLYHRGRREVLEYMYNVLTKLVALIPTKEIKYYVLKETDNIEDILKGVEDDGRRKIKTDERNNNNED